MNDLFSTLETLSANSSFSAELSRRGGYITFSNSGRRGAIKYFQIGLDSLLITLRDILDNLSVFSRMTNYDETEWRDNGSLYFTDPVANANSTVQTKPLFSTLSKLIIWGNQPAFNSVDSDQRIIIQDVALRNTIEKLEMISDSFTPDFAIGRSASHRSDSDIQKIYYGCPGTGKSFKVKKLAEGLHDEKIVYFDESGVKIPDISSVVDRTKVTSNVFRTTFHPDYDYSTFVGSYKPVMNPVLDSDGNDTGAESLSYEFVPQVFTNAYVRAWKSLGDDTLSDAEKQVYLIIEEINRGNCAQIFGDLFQLLDRNDGRSEFSIIPDAELRKYLSKMELESNKLQLPENLHILATMNTSDQSLFPMDSAFKRRWAMEYVPINLEHPKAGLFTFEVNGKEYSWVAFLKKVNPLIRKATDSEDKQMGEFFIKSSIDQEYFLNKVMFYIWNDVCKDLYSTSRISPLYFMRSAAGDDKKDVFTFAELFGKGRLNEEDGSYTLPVDIIEGFITSYLELKAISDPESEPESGSELESEQEEQSE